MRSRSTSPAGSVDAGRGRLRPTRRVVVRRRRRRQARRPPPRGSAARGDPTSGSSSCRLRCTGPSRHGRQYAALARGRHVEVAAAPVRRGTTPRGDRTARPGRSSAVRRRPASRAGRSAVSTSIGTGSDRLRRPPGGSSPLRCRWCRAAAPAARPARVRARRRPRPARRGPRGARARRVPRCQSHRGGARTRSDDGVADPAATHCRRGLRSRWPGRLHGCDSDLPLERRRGDHVSGMNTGLRGACLRPSTRSSTPDSRSTPTSCARGATSVSGASRPACAGP